MDYTDLNLNLESNRLKTFDNWKSDYIDKYVLALNGFYYIGKDNKVKCQFCKIQIHNWSKDDNIYLEHIKYSSSCPLLNNYNNTNIPNNIDSFNKMLEYYSKRTVSEGAIDSILTNDSFKNGEPTYPAYSTYLIRKNTFVNWPIATLQHPCILARYGLYYSGSGDIVICHYCGCNINNWSPNDEIYDKHLKINNKCNFIQIVKDVIQSFEDTNDTIINID